MAQAAAAADHHYTATGLNSWKVGFWTFMGSECLFFATLISTYMVYKGQSVTGPYTEEILNIPLTSVSTFVLLMSSLAVVLMLDGINRKSRKLTMSWLAVVIVLGTAFIGFQVVEFTEFVHHGLTIQQNVFGSSFYVLTGFHGAHVTVGVIWLSTLFIQMARGKMQADQKDYLKFEIAGLYWHFVDVVWIVIFTLVYLIQ